MSSRALRLLPLLAEMSSVGRAMSLTEAAHIAAMSPWHLQREFARAVGESPAKYQQRIRLERAAAELRTTDARIIDVAFAAGFASHEAFTRAFTNHFEISPKHYRQTSAPLSNEAREHTINTSRCVGLHRVSTTTSQTNREPAMPTSDITTETTEEVPTIVGRRRVDREQLPTAIGEILPAAYTYAMANGLTMAGPPFVRHLGQSAAFIEIEAGVPLVDAAGDVTEDGLFAGTLPGGDVVTAIHEGSYDTLEETHVALDRWISANGATSAGGPWEIYLTDPGEVPEPADWRTKIIWPLSS